MRWTDSDVVAQLATKQIKLVDDFSFISKHHKFSCDVCGHMWSTTPRKIIVNGTGCPSCAGILRSSTAEFVVSAQQIHGCCYDYGEVEYTNAHRAVNIVCKKHGSFTQTPNQHLSGNGCPQCANNTKSTNDEFDKKLADAARGVSRVGEYVGSHVPLLFKCDVCNYEWHAKPTKLIGKTATGCPSCRTKKGVYGTFVEHNGIRFRSILESKCYDIISQYCVDRGFTFEHQKKYPQSTTNHSCDFFIIELKLWVEVSNINTSQYTSRMQRKIKWVQEINENFILAQTADKLKEILYGEI